MENEDLKNDTEYKINNENEENEFITMEFHEADINKNFKILLNKCGIRFTTFDQLNNLLILRDLLLNMDKYKNIEKDLEYFKKVFHTSNMTAFYANAKQVQKWPLLNLVRQILKMCNYKLTPVRKCNGYSPEGKKLFTRYFLIEYVKK